MAMMHASLDIFTPFLSFTETLVAITSPFTYRMCYGSIGLSKTSDRSTCIPSSLLPCLRKLANNHVMSKVLKKVYGDDSALNSAQSSKHARNIYKM